MRTCMVVYSHYPFDPRVKRESEALVENGIAVDVICVRDRGEQPFGEYNGVRVTRLPMSIKRGGILRYSIQYGLFFGMVQMLLLWRTITKRYDVIHFHSLPDFIVFTGMIPRLFGSRVILDLHEAMPEIFMSKIKNDSLFRIMKVLERMSIHFADHVITVNDIIRDLFIRRGADEKKLHVIMNVPQSIPILPGKESNSFEESLKIVFCGRLNEHNDFSPVLKGIASMKDRMGMELHIIGDGEMETEIQMMAKDLSISDRIFFHGRVPHEEVIPAISAYDVAIIPLKRSPITELAIPTKMWDYVAAGAPILSPDLGAIRAMMGKNIRYYHPEVQSSFCEGILGIIKSDPDDLRNENQTAKENLHEIRWEVMKERLLSIYGSIEIGKGGMKPVGS